MIVPRAVLGGSGYVAPSDKLNIAAIGAGGKGNSNIRMAARWEKGSLKTMENIVALCDVDQERAAETFKQFPDAKRYKDFRVMLEEMKDDIDAVMISTPDHTHAVAAMACMQSGKHVYVEKPLTHNIYEARMLTETAKRLSLVTQMGNQGNSSNDIRRICEWIWAGEIGDVRQVHAWTNRPVWPQGLPAPTETMQVPAHLDWDLWQGPAPERGYHQAFLPFKWRGWWDYGTGALGDMACHIIDPVFKALKLGYPTSVEASKGVVFVADFQRAETPESCPPSSLIHFEFPSRGAMPAVKLHWYDGGMMPQRPAELKDDEQMGDWSGGVIFVGDKGKIMCGCYAANPKLLPTSKMEGFNEPEQVLKRVEGNHQTSWVAACKAGDNSLASSSFDYAGPLTETILMGNLAIRSLDIKELVPGKDPNRPNSYIFTGNKKLLWDGENMKITNYEPANQFVKRQYRNGWSLGV